MSEETCWDSIRKRLGRGFMDYSIPLLVPPVEGQLFPRRFVVWRKLIVPGPGACFPGTNKHREYYSIWIVWRGKHALCPI
jgi:hypothetical protein